MNDTKLAICAGINNIQVLIATIELHKMGLIKDIDYIGAMQILVKECGRIAEQLKDEAETKEEEE